MVSQKLLIVESPAKCGKIEGFLGPGYKCMATYGHLRTLNNLKNIDFSNNFKPTFTTLDSKTKQIKALQWAVDRCDEVIIATDNDREGEAIAWHICMLFKLSLTKTKRIIFKEITKTAIVNAVKNPEKIDLNLVYAQHCRQIVDLMVGFKISPILWDNISRNSKDGLSAGRCQTPALKLVYDNYKEIEQSPGTIVFNIQGSFTNINLMFTLNKHFNEEKEAEGFFEKSLEFSHIFSRGQPKKSVKKSPQPFTTSSLQQVANTELRSTPKDTMRACQKLYEAGLITYMRTDSRTYNKEFVDSAKKYIEKTWNEKYVNEKIDDLTERRQEKKKDKPKSQEAHEAIRPTNITRKTITDDFTLKEQKMYALIWRNTCQSCMSSAVYSSLQSKISAPDSYEYRYSCEEPIFLGWHILSNTEPDSKSYNYVLSMKNNEAIKYNKLYGKTGLKDAKTHLTEARLVNLLESKGIGRPSTFSSLVEKIQERKYVKRGNVVGIKVDCNEYEVMKKIKKTSVEKNFGNEKNKLIIQPVGIIVIEFLYRHFDSMFAYDYTKHMEDMLDEIAQGKALWHNLCSSCDKEITVLSKELKPSKACIKIDDNHDYIIGKYGPIIKYTNPNTQEVTFKKVKTNINISRLRENQYTLEEVLEDNHDTRGMLIGEYQDHDLYLKKGQFGLYVEWGKNKRSIASINIEEADLTLDNITEYLSKNNSILREIDEHSNIRKGKYGEYIFIKKPTMKKPKFVGLSGFEHDIYTCDIKELIDWIKEKK